MNRDYTERPKSIIRKPVVLKKSGLCNTALYEAMANGEFPKQIQLSKRSVGWIESEVDDWIDARIAERDGVAA